MDKIKIVIADDHIIVREGIAAIISSQPDFDVVGEAADGRQAVDLAGKLNPDIILMDLRMPEMDGVQAMKAIRDAYPKIQFIVLTTYDTDEYIFKGIEAGARAYILKDSPRESLFKAIRAVYKGEAILEPGITGRVLERLNSLSRHTPSAEQLSDREIEVLALMGKSSTNKAIAEKLDISESTVKTHIQSIFAKLKVNSRTQAVIEGMNRGIIRL